MATLPPTVHERLARCGTTVLVTGLAHSADVELDVGGAVIAFTATSGQRTVTVPSLVAGEHVRARQDEGFGFSPWSPTVTVEDVALPPQASPRLPSQVGICSHCVDVGGVVPGSRVELRVGGALVGEGTASRHGGGCVGVDLVHFGGDPPGALTAVMEVCGSVSPPASAPLVAESPLTKPRVLGPLFGCQQTVPLDAVHRGARVSLESTSGPLGGFCSCWHRVDVGIGTPLTTGTSVRAQPLWDGRGPCRDDGPWSDWEPVVAPDERIAPTIQAPLIEGDLYLRVTGQIVGATRLVTIVLPDSTIREWGPVPSDEEVEIALAEPLVAGSTVTVTQTLCTVSAISDPVVVQPAPPEVVAPTIIPSLYACGAQVQVSNLHAGALVRLFADGIPIGSRWVGMQSSVAVTAAPSLVAGQEIAATQEIGGVLSDQSEPVMVEEVKELHRPRLVGPVAVGDGRVLVSGLTPGCRVTVRADGLIVGQAHVAETLARVPLWTPAKGTLSVAADICGLTAEGDRLQSVASPCTAGPLATGASDLSFADWQVPATIDGVAFTTGVHGVVYFPADGGGPDTDRTDLPVVVIAHGFWDVDWLNPDTGDVEPIESYRGYDYLGHHLASWGMLVFSITMDDVNTSTMTTNELHTFARGEIILHAVDEILGHPTFGDMADKDRIGIIGHSMAGEGVIAAQQLNRDEGRGYALRGIVSLAPTRWRDDIVVSDTDYLQIYGSMDQLNHVAVGANAPFAGVRSYDGAARPKSHAWVHGLRHNPFNRRWLATTDFAEASYASAAAPATTHELVARCVIGAFVLRSVVGRGEYADYMLGQVLPSALEDVAVHLQHSRGPRTVLDNFGDADAQVGLPADGLDGTSNSLGLVVENVPAGSLAPFADVELIGLPDTSHDTNGVRFGWAGPGAVYRQQAAGSVPAPHGALALRTAQLYDDAAANPPGLAADMIVVVRDGAGRTAQVRLGAASTIPYPDHDLGNDDGPDPLAMMRTISLPIDAFTAAAPGLDHADIRVVELRMSARPTGHLVVDDLEFWG